MTDRTPPPPIPKKALGNVLKAIGRMESKQIALAMQSFKPSELMTLFVDPEHHYVLMEAYRLCEPSGHTTELFVRCEVPPEYGNKTASIRFWWNTSVAFEAFYVPFKEGGDATWPVSPRREAPPELVERFDQLATDWITTAYRFAQVRRTLALLNKPRVCRTLAQMRYYWPCIVMILRSAGHKDLADSIVDINPRADNANLSRDLWRLLAPSNQTVASHMLIEDVPAPPQPPVPYELHHNFG
jgi:hypothetical protein